MRTGYTIFLQQLTDHSLPIALAPADMNAWSEDTIEELDYDRRLGCYATLLPALWARFNQAQALPLLLTAHHDLTNVSDLALRQAASQALVRFVESAQASVQQVNSKQT